MGEGRGFGRRLADVGLSGTSAAGQVAALLLPPVLNNGAGGGIYIVLILRVSGKKLHLVYHTAVLIVVVSLQEHHVPTGHTRMGQGSLLGGLHTDIGALAGCTYRVQRRVGGGRAGLSPRAVRGLDCGGIGQQIQLIDGQPHQGLKREMVATVHQGLDQRGLAQRDAILVRLLLKGAVPTEGLGEDRSVDFGGV